MSAQISRFSPVTSMRVVLLIANKEVWKMSLSAIQIKNTVASVEQFNVFSGCARDNAPRDA